VVTQAFTEFEHVDSVGGVSSPCPFAINGDKSSHEHSWVGKAAGWMDYQFHFEHLQRQGSCGSNLIMSWLMYCDEMSRNALTAPGSATTHGLPSVPVTVGNGVPSLRKSLMLMWPTPFL
jgi:hypothetical protein